MRRCENWLETYLEYTRETEAPEMFHFWTALVTLAGALERKVYMSQNFFTWVPNLYVILVGRPGIVTKSTAMRIGRRLLRETGAKFGPDSMTWQALVSAFQDAQKPILAPGQDPLMGEHDVQAPLTFYISELGTILDTSDNSLMSMLIEMWDAEQVDWKRKTVTHGDVNIRNPIMSMIGGTTPAWLQNNFGPEMIGGGFVSRIIAVYGKEKRKLIAYPKRHVNPLNEQLEDDLKNDILHIHGLVGEMDLSEEAYAFGEQWYRDHYERMKNSNDGMRKGDYMARKQAHMHKLAMLLSLAASDSMVLEAKYLIQAKNILMIAERDIDTVLKNVTSAQQQARNKQEVLEILQNGSAVDKVEAYKKVYTFMTFRDFDIAVTDLMQAGRVTQLAKQGKMFLSLIKPGYDGDHNPDKSTKEP